MLQNFEKELFFLMENIVRTFDFVASRIIEKKEKKNFSQKTTHFKFHGFDYLSTTYQLAEITTIEIWFKKRFKKKKSSLLPLNWKIFLGYVRVLNAHMLIWVIFPTPP